jgi:hypothetical protein
MSPVTENLTAESLLAEMRADPSMILRCRWVANPDFPDPDHAKGGWGALGCGPVIGTTAAVQELYNRGLIRVIGPNFSDIHHNWFSLVK